VRRIHALEQSAAYASVPFAVPVSSTSAGAGEAHTEHAEALPWPSPRVTPPVPPAGGRKHSRALLLLCALAVVAFVAVLVYRLSTPPGSRPDSAARATPSTMQSAPVVAKGRKPPVKVFILAGQSDMEGRGAVRTLDWLGQDPKYGHLLEKIKNKDGTWVVRKDVWVYQLGNRGLLTSKLTVGYGEKDDEIGPELLFGHVMADHFGSPVLLIKIVQGAMSLGEEGRPPSSGGMPGKYYQDVIRTVPAVLNSLKTNFPEYEGQGYEVAGFVWFQGWNDMIDPIRRSQYESNLVNLIKDIRHDLKAAQLPVVVGELGVYGKETTDQKVLTFRKAQAAATQRPEFRGNVAFVETTPFWDKDADAVFERGYVNNKWKDKKTQDEFEKMGNTFQFLYLGSGKTYALIGNAFGEAMKKMCPRP
jgi:alpha-galactosidase